MATCIRSIFFLTLLVIEHSLAANILILCLPLFSHILPPANVGKVLQEQGHNVTIAIPPQMQEKVARFGLNFMVYHSLGDLDLNKAVTKEITGVLLGEKAKSIGILGIILELSQKLLKDQEFLENIRAYRPDLMVLDPTTTPGRLLTLIAYKLDIPFVFIGSCSTPQYGHVPILPSVVPNMWVDYTDEMTFLQRLHNTYLELLLYFRHPLIPSTAFKDYVPEKPDISMQDLQAKALLWVIVEDGVLGYNAPIMPNVKLVSHLLELKPKPLSKEFQSFMDNAKDGVIIVSFGSIIKSLPAHIFHKFLTAFKKTKYRFVMRHSESNTSDPNKFLFSNWIPQFELLSHKNAKLFITHCGDNGQEEAIYAGIPMLGFPVFADQPHNAARMVKQGFGLRIDLQSFTVDDVISAIEELVGNPQYKARAEKASAIFRAARVWPVDEAAYWINHVLIFGGEHLRSVGQDIPQWKYLGLDVIAFCVLIWHIFIFSLVKALYFMFSLCCSRKGKTKKE